jgi:large conductance mechanosensitive channel
MRGFKQFLLRGNVADLAVGIVIAPAFAGRVSAIVKDILPPLIGAKANTCFAQSRGFVFMCCASNFSPGM